MVDNAVSGGGVRSLRQTVHLNRRILVGSLCFARVRMCESFKSDMKTYPITSHTGVTTLVGSNCFTCMPTASGSTRAARRNHFDNDETEILVIPDLEDDGEEDMVSTGK